MIERPNKKELRQTLAVMSQLHKSLSEISGSAEAVRKAVRQNAGDIKHELTLEALREIGVDTLNANKSGIRVSLLKNAGLENVAQVYQMSTRRLTNINGIGDDSAAKIKAMARIIYNSVFETANIRIDVDTPSAAQDELLTQLYQMQSASYLSTQAEKLLAGAAHIESALADAAPAASSLRWAFSSRAQKENASLAYGYLESLESGSFGELALRIIAEYNSIAHVDTAFVYADFEASSVDYYTALEGMGLAAARSPASGLPADMVVDIENYPLDTTHMKATLRQYQQFGTKYILRQQKVLLGDEMGLGKTIQALAVFADLKAKGASHFLVVCPASVLVNWKRECDKHTDLSSIIIHGSDKLDELILWKKQGGVGITNYESLQGLSFSMDIEIAALVVDEAHYVKNPEALRTQALKRLAQRAERVLYMTGTPLENRVDEMCFLVSCLRPDISENISSMKMLSATDKFKAELAPVYLRRKRDDVLTELPDLIESEDWLEPNRDEMLMYYAAVIDRNFMAMRRVSWDVDIKKSSKARRLLEICEQSREDGRKIIVFSFFRDTIDAIIELLGERAIGPITGSISSAKRQELIDEFSKAGAGAVLVSQIQAGGVGLNIQAASVVIFAEPQIKPSLETQAISRAYRLGQLRAVRVHRLLCADTVDEHIMQILLYKQQEFDMYAKDSAIGAQSLKQGEGAWSQEIIEREAERLNQIMGEQSRQIGEIMNEDSLRF